MPKLYNQAVRDVCGALRHEGVRPKEIVRRLNNDEAGLGFPVEIKERRVYEYIEDYNAEHGPPPGPEDEDQTLDSMRRLRRRAIALIQREITTLEKRRPGKLSVKESQALKAHFATLDDMERREEAAEKRRGKTPARPAPNGNGNGQSKGAESALERVAREQREQEARDGK